jgi:chemotaxis family two-component system sensor kinase Cph1
MSVAAAALIDKSRCAEEPIHIPGTIQSHGMLLVLSDPELVVLQASANIGTMLGVAVDVALGSAVAAVLGTAAAEQLERILRRDGAGPIANPLRFTLGKAEPVEFECIALRSGARILLELEPLERVASPNRFDAFGHVRASIERMEDAADIAALVRGAAEAIRLISGFDRAMVYRFDEDWHGDVISESTADGVPVAYLGLRFPAGDIPEQARRLYLTNPLRLIVDAGYVPVPLVPECDPADGKPLDLSYAILLSVSPIHLEYLHNIGVRATLTISLIVDGRLWGLIACHHLQPRRLDYVTRASCEFFGRMLSWQLGSRLNADDAERKLAAYSLVAAYTRTLSFSSDIAQVLLAEPQPLLELFAGQGLVVRLDGAIGRYGVTPDDATVGSIASALRPHIADGIADTNQIAALVPAAARERANASGAILITLSASGDDYLLCLRDEVIRSIDWAGDIRVPITESAGKLHPRSSFALWRETLRGQSARWTAQDIDSARRLRKRILERLEVLEHVQAEERLRHVAHHDPLTQLPNRAGSMRRSRAYWATRSATAASLRCCSSISTISSRSTTRSDTLPATASCRPRERGCGAACGTTTSWRASAATSSSSSRPNSRKPTMPISSRARF